MAKLVFANLETCCDNTDADCLTLYYDQEPEREQVKTDLDTLVGKFNVSVDTSSSWHYDVRPTPVSRLAGLVRIQAGPCG